MSKRKPFSRRKFLKTAGGYTISLPFLEAMLPQLVYAQNAQTKRFVTSFAGTVIGNNSNPGSYGALPTTFPASLKALESLRDSISIISNLDLPVHASGSNPTAPASAVLSQHGSTPAPILSGATSEKGKPILVMKQSADQFVAKSIGQSTPFESLQMRVQVQSYSGSNNNRNGIMSAKETNGIVNALPPLYSPKQIYDLLFGNFSNPTAPPTSSGPHPLAGKASVLDLLLSDIKNIRNRVSGRDRVRLEQHFDEIRKIEKNIQSQINQGSGSGSATGGSCIKPTSPGNDPAIGANSFSGWSNETLRGEVMADLIAYALACDLTRVVSWMLTFEQVFLGNAVNQTSDMHDDSHNASTRTPVISANANWHSALFARLIQKLKSLDDGGSTLLDNTFLSLIFSEGPNAHQKTNMRQIVAGNGSQIVLGQHFNGGGNHPGKIQITGMQSVGLNINALNELSGTLSFLQR